MTIFDEGTKIKERLVAVNVRATTDPRRIDPPCVLVVPTEVVWNSNCLGDGLTLWTLHVLGPQPGGEDTLKSMSSMISKIVQAFPEVRQGRMASYQADNGQPWPSYDLSWEVSSSWA